MKQEKRVCIVNIKDIKASDEPEAEVYKPGDRVMRVTLSLARKLIANGNWAFTSKSKLKSFINKQIKLTKNAARIDFIQNITGESLNEYKFNGTTMAVSAPTFVVAVKDNDRVRITRTGTKLITESVKNKAGGYTTIKRRVPDIKSVWVKKMAKNISKEVVLRHTGNQVLITNF